jgi:SAM-dependent methyltransferase
MVWQPDVYSTAARVAERLGAQRIIDIGCGDGQKLAELRSRFDLYGIDFGANIEACRRDYDFGTWIEHDLDSDEPLPIPRPGDRRAVVVCSDVIEHVIHPARLLLKLQTALESGCALIVSTPERELTSGAHDLGPPQNPAHVREWTLEEFGAFLRWSGFASGQVGLTRSNNRHAGRHTILAVLYPNVPSDTLKVNINQKRLALMRRRIVLAIRALAPKRH